MEWTSTSLRVLRAVAELGSFSAAATALDYTQSAVSRQIATLERAAGAPLFQRSPRGVRITPAGRVLLGRATTALDGLDEGYQLLHGRAADLAVVRLGVFTSAAAVLLPRVLAEVRHHSTRIEVVAREAASATLLRAIRAGTVDVAVIGQQPPYPVLDDQQALAIETLVEGPLAVAVSTGSPAAAAGSMTLEELDRAHWIAGPAGEPGFGIWPALSRRPRTVHQARDWTAKLALVAAGCGVTTAPPYLAGVAPSGVRFVPVVDGPTVLRRAALVTRHGTGTPALHIVVGIVRRLTEELAGLSVY